MTEKITSEEIKKLRQKMKCNQEEFCKIMAITVATLSRWETGKVVPHGKNDELLKILKEKLKDEEDPEKLKKILLVGGVLAFKGVSPLALMASGLLSREFLNSSISQLYSNSDNGQAFEEKGNSGKDESSA